MIVCRGVTMDRAPADRLGPSEDMRAGWPQAVNAAAPLAEYGPKPLLRIRTGG